MYFLNEYFIENTYFNIYKYIIKMYAINTISDISKIILQKRCIHLILKKISNYILGNFGFLSIFINSTTESDSILTSTDSILNSTTKLDSINESESILPTESDSMLN